MPLDATGGRNIVSLADLLTEIGVTSVPMKDLEAHKLAQVRSHPPSLLGTPKPYVGLGVLAFVCAMASQSMGAMPTLAVTTGAFFFAITAAGLFLFVMAMVLDTFGIKLKGRPQWIERHTYADERFAYADPMPAPVLEVMRHIHDRLPKASFFYGELVQKAEILDPYLVVEICSSDLGLAGQRACLGIWDDSGIIRIAAITP